MKKYLVCLIAVLAMGTSAMKAGGVEFAYEAGAELVSSYLWRGQYNGGLSFQPTATVGFESDHVQFQIGAWANIGASDWGFKKGLPEITIGDFTYNPNTQFKPEIDVIANLRIHGLNLGFTHYYYCDGTNFFNFGNIKDIEGSSQTEITVGVDLDDITPENHHIYANWYTMVSGDDANYDIDDSDNEIIKRAYSSYIEVGYDYTFEKPGLTLGAQLGIVPWASNDVYGTEGAALKCINLKLNKAWDLDICEIDLFAQAMIDTYKVNKDNVFIKGSGDDKLYNQKLNGCIGLGIWF